MLPSHAKYISGHIKSYLGILRVSIDRVGDSQYMITSIHGNTLPRYGNNISIHVNMFTRDVNMFTRHVNIHSIHC
jgi:hypothetical protein